MKRYILTLICAVIGYTAALAFTVKGVVTEPSGEPAIGATVVEKGEPTNGTATNLDGEFTINVKSAKSTLVVSYIGFEQQDVPVDGRSDIKVELKSTGGLNLDEVVIVGYGVQKKSTQPVR